MVCDEGGRREEGGSELGGLRIIHWRFIKLPVIGRVRSVILGVCISSRDSRPMLPIGNNHSPIVPDPRTPSW